MGSFLVAAVVLATAISSVAFGIFTAYYTVIAVLSAFGEQCERAPIALIPSQNHVSGD